MSFQRTPSGLSNTYLFFGVDAVVLVEGGDSRSVQDVLSGAFNNESQDISFWRKCFSELMPAVRVAFRAVGSKATLHNIALLVQGGSVTHIYVAMDRDFDNLLGQIVNSPKVMYTFGYSWENDVWNPIVVEEVFYTMCGVCRNTTEVAVKKIINKCFVACERDLRWATKADFICFQNGISLLPRKRPMRMITPGTGGNAPAINKAALKQCVGEAQSKKTARITTNTNVRLEPLVDCYGHMIAAFSYHLLVHLFKKFCNNLKCPQHLADSTAIGMLFDKVREGQFGHLRTYYLQQLTA